MHKPMLACDCGPVEALRFPLLASPKLDGVRALIGHDGVYARSLKKIPNRNVQSFLSGLPFGLDGELIVGDPTAPDAYRRTVSVVMSDDKPIDGLTFYVFDLQPDAPFIPFRERLGRLDEILGGLENAGSIERVPQIAVADAQELQDIEAAFVGDGYEGLILRDPQGPYKHGRSTLKEGYLLKLKRFEDGEAEVIGVTELMHNANEAKTNELGRTARSHKKAGMVPTGTMGTLTVRDLKTGVEFEIGTGFTSEQRREIWQRRLMYGGVEGRPLAKYKHFPVGAKDKPRHPVFLGWRSPIDL